MGEGEAGEATSDKRMTTKRQHDQQILTELFDSAIPPEGQPAMFCFRNSK